MSYALCDLQAARIAPSSSGARFWDARFIMMSVNGYSTTSTLEGLMISRRELLTAGMAGGLSSSADATPVAATESQEVAGMLQAISRDIRALDSTLSRAALSNAVVFGLVEKVRAQFETFFRTNQKFPDFIDVGLGVFLDLYDWHIKNRQQLTITRGADGRYWMQFMFTTVIVRAEHDANYIGIPYDKA